MIRLLLAFFLDIFKSKSQLQLENLFLRKQLEIALRSSVKGKTNPFDRFFLSRLKDLIISWRDSLLIVKPDTFIRWHRQSFRSYWRQKSQNKGGRPKTSQDQINLIRKMANQNPGWGAPRILGEMLMLGFDISQSVIQRILRSIRRQPSGQRWTTFFKNHASEIVALDFFSVPTINFRILYVLVFLSIERRKIIFFNVTEHPDSEWSIQQLRNAFYDEPTPRIRYESMAYTNG